MGTKRKQRPVKHRVQRTICRKRKRNASDAKRLQNVPSNVLREHTHRRRPNIIQLERKQRNPCQSFEDKNCQTEQSTRCYSIPNNFNLWTGICNVGRWSLFQSLRVPARDRRANTSTLHNVSNKILSKVSTNTDCHVSTSIAQQKCRLLVPIPKLLRG